MNIWLERNIFYLFQGSKIGVPGRKWRCGRFGKMGIVHDDGNEFSRLHEASYGGAKVNFP